MNTPTRSYADPLHMAQRGLLFKREPQPVTRELPRATGLRVLQVGDVLRARVAPERLFVVLAHRPCCAACLGTVTVREDGRVFDLVGRKLAWDLEHADGAGIEVRP